MENKGTDLPPPVPTLGSCSQLCPVSPAMPATSPLPSGSISLHPKTGLAGLPSVPPIACPQAGQGLNRPAGVSVAVGRQDGSREEEGGRGDLAVS